MKKLILLLVFSLSLGLLLAQVPKKKTIISSDDQKETNINSIQSITNNNTAAPTTQNQPKDSLGFEHRNDAKDSITIYYKFLDGVKKYYLDSTINDIDKYYSVPTSYLYLGNNGAAATPLIYQPNLNIGFDAGFHAFDIYLYTLENTRYYKTTKPFTSLSYQLATGKEQMLKANHVQSPHPNFNIGFDYKLITAPGLFITQNTNHNSYRIFSNYQGKKKRYQAYFSMIGNQIKASENGGIQNIDDLSDPNKKDRFTIPVNLGNGANFRNNPFVTTVLTGNQYKNFNIFCRQSYDLGKKDSIVVNDSTTQYLFYPRIRFQHTLIFNTQSYHFSDIYADSSIYALWFGQNLKHPTDTFQIKESWKIMSNDFSIVQFPDLKNTAQYFNVGITFQNIRGDLKNQTGQFNNLMIHGAYQNRTRNKLWDVLLNGELYARGLNVGDYSVNAHLLRIVNHKGGNVALFFSNRSRTPSFIFDNRSVFHLGVPIDIKKENITSLGAEFSSNVGDIKIANHVIVNHAYFYDYVNAQQWNQAINLLQISLSKKIKLHHQYFWYVDLTFQQVNASSPIRVPFLYSRNRFVFERTLYKNLNLSTGLDVRYFSSFYANGYSPLLGQFFKQDATRISNLPDIAAYAHFRIKGFAGFLRAENLNTARFKNGFGFTHNNFVAPLYPSQGLMIRFGIQWWFVN